jgi:hypothetical protein
VLYALLYSRLLLAMTGLEQELYLQNQKIVTSQSAEWLLQISMLTTMPMLVELSLAKGFFQVSGLKSLWVKGFGLQITDASHLLHVIVEQRAFAKEAV